MNRDEIMKIIPHRGNMLLLDEAVLEDGVARGRLKLRGDEWFLDGHFPGDPIVPGVILCEILAQSTCTLLCDRVSGSEGEFTPLFAGLDKVRFTSSVRPGDTFETECRIVRSKSNFYFASGVGRVDGRLCVSAEFSFVLMPKESDAAAPATGVRDNV